MIIVTFIKNCRRLTILYLAVWEPFCQTRPESNYLTLTLESGNIIRLWKVSKLVAQMINRPESSKSFPHYNRLLNADKDKSVLLELDQHKCLTTHVELMFIEIASRLLTHFCCHENCMIKACSLVMHLIKILMRGRVEQCGNESKILRRSPRILTASRKGYLLIFFNKFSTSPERPQPKQW